MQRELGISFIHVTHSQDEAMALADMMVVMQDGHIRQAGSPREVFSNPATSFIARFIGGHNVLPREAGLIAVRADRCRLTDAGAGLPAQVEAVEYQGGMVRIAVTTTGGGERIGPAAGCGIRRKPDRSRHAQTPDPGRRKTNAAWQPEGNGPMSEPIWNQFLTERDKAVFAAAGFGARQGFGKRPALLVVDVSWAFCGERPEPILDSIKKWRSSCGEDAWVALPYIRSLRDKAHEKGDPGDLHHRHPSRR